MEIDGMVSDPYGWAKGCLLWISCKKMDHITRGLHCVIFIIIIISSHLPILSDLQSPPATCSSYSPSPLDTAASPHEPAIKESCNRFDGLITHSHKDTFSPYMMNNDHIESQFCSCHGSWAVVACANLWPDWSIRINIGAKWVFTRFQSLAHRLFVKWFSA